jgi:cob(I)alamin adenosyltransferase
MEGPSSMSIYTRKGDEGYTKRANGKRVRKSDRLVAAVGTLDELNSHIGLCLAAANADKRHDRAAQCLRPLQGELLAHGACLSAAGPRRRSSMDYVQPAIERMEGQIDAIWTDCGELHQFILPGGCELAARLHVARCICRRTERDVVASVERETRVPREIIKYLNRLSDLLFALARLANHQAGVDEVTWP